VLGERFMDREPELLALAKEWLPRLPFPATDVLLLQEIGKNISGSGMDPNVTGRFALKSIPKPVEVTRLIVLGLTEESHGNAAGIGFADIISRRAADAIDLAATYTNHVTSQLLDGARLPLIAESDQEALTIAVRTLYRRPPAEARIAWARNTLEVGELWMSEPLWSEVRDRPELGALSEPEPLRFTSEGALVV
jgi:hypothetical protein